MEQDAAERHGCRLIDGTDQRSLEHRQCDFFTGRMNETKGLEQQRLQTQALKQVEKARQARLKRREKRSFGAQCAAMDRKGIDPLDKVYVMGRHWDPDQPDSRNPDTCTQKCNATSEQHAESSDARR